MPKTLAALPISHQPTPLALVSGNEEDLDEEEAREFAAFTTLLLNDTAGASTLVVAHLRGGACRSLRIRDAGGGAAADNGCGRNRQGPQAIDARENWAAALRRPSWKKAMILAPGMAGGEGCRSSRRS